MAKRMIPRPRHGWSGKPEYRSWQAMRNRCYREIDPSFGRYGARGITVHEPWRVSFLAFLNDVGPKPTPKHTLGRIDNDGNYEPGNVRWETPTEQNNNRAVCRIVEFQNRRMSLSDACRLAGGGVTEPIASSRLRSGWDLDRALSDPPREMATARLSRNLDLCVILLRAHWCRRDAMRTVGDCADGGHCNCACRNLCVPKHEKEPVS